MIQGASCSIGKIIVSFSGLGHGQGCGEDFGVFWFGNTQGDHPGRPLADAPPAFDEFLLAPEILPEGQSVIAIEPFLRLDLLPLLSTAI